MTSEQRPPWAWTGTRTVRLAYESTIASSKKTGSAWKKIRARLVDSDDNPAEHVTATGEFYDASVGMRFTCTASIKRDTFRNTTTWILDCTHIQGEALTEKQAMCRLIQGFHTKLTDGRAQLLYQRYGDRAVAALAHPETHVEAFQHIDIDPGSRSARVIRNRATEALPKVTSILLMNQAEIPPNLQTRIMKHAGTDVYRFVQEYPYALHRTLQQMTFEQDDALFGLVHTDQDTLFHPARIVAGITHVLQKQAQDGHCYNELPRITRSVETLLGIKQVQDHYKRAQQHPTFHELLILDDQNRIWLRQEHDREQQIVERILQLIQTTPYTKQRVDDAMNTVIRLRTFEAKRRPSDAQINAVQTALTHGVTVISGSAGTGKTTLVDVLVATVSELGDYPVYLAAPTNRAALRLSQITNHKATTIHKLVGSGINDIPTYTREKPLPVGIYVIDEAAMPNMAAIWMLLEAIPNGSAVVFIGDPSQLQPIGAGNVLRDLISAITVISEQQACPIGYVTFGRDDVFRSDNSNLIDFWYAVRSPQTRQGGIIEEKPEKHISNRVQIRALNTSQDIEDYVEATVQQFTQKIEANPQGTSLTYARIRRSIRLPPIIAQQYRGSAGVIALNKRIQRIVNPGDPRLKEFTKGTYTFREGDICVWENDSEEDTSELVRMRRLHGMENADDDVEVATGQILAITGIYPDVITVDVITEQETEEPVSCEVPRTDWKAALGYALTCNKAQGSEWPHVFVVLNKRDIPRRAWVYTAVTRARKAVMVLGHTKYLFLTDKTTHRTGLAHALTTAVLDPDQFRRSQKTIHRRREKFNAEEGTVEAPHAHEQPEQTMTIDEFFQSLDVQ